MSRKFSAGVGRILSRRLCLPSISFTSCARCRPSLKSSPRYFRQNELVMRSTMGSTIVTSMLGAIVVVLGPCRSFKQHPEPSCVCRMYKWRLWSGLPSPYPKACSSSHEIFFSFLGDPFDSVVPFLCCHFSYFSASLGVLQHPLIQRFSYALNVLRWSVRASHHVDSYGFCSKYRRTMRVLW